MAFEYPSPPPQADPTQLANYHAAREQSQRQTEQRIHENSAQINDDRQKSSLGEGLAALAAHAIDDIISASPQRSQHACRAGCAWCCHQPVFLTTPESIAIVSHLLSSWPANRIELLRARLKEKILHRLALGGNRAVLKQGLACAFLNDDNSCAIHPARPLACRGYLSSSATACAERFVDPNAAPPPIDPHVHFSTCGVIHGLQIALHEADLNAGLRDLHRAVLELLPPALHHQSP
jgi:Putative zinc- or iron-chelating domain